MIKQLIGLLMALITIAVIVFTVLGRESYTSLVWESTPTVERATAIVKTTTQPASDRPMAPVSDADTTAVR